VGSLALDLLAAALTVKLRAEQGRPDLARHQMYRALDVLAALDDRLPELLDPPPAPAGSGPVQNRRSP
jgi:hypothetical protein